MKPYQNQLDTITEAANWLESTTEDDALLVLEAVQIRASIKYDPELAVQVMRQIVADDNPFQRFGMYRAAQQILDVAVRL